ncbi:ferredoxin reductase family protein [Nioella sp. MMSF_3534]|uniref:ferredoxin reductase family protein n=1 Tax=Nioella sp. MMSF_3534 TaxID=3046720 RepID=UPI00273DE346|nr:ferredoxin reductase family protein [Nioella sp. MMSF_3534]
MRSFGLLVVAVSCLIPGYLFIRLPDITDPVALFSQYLGTLALILMAWAQLMATRAPSIEALMGPMDRVYVLHKWSGIIAMTAILLHDTIDADMDGIGRETALTEIAETLGELSLYGLLVLVVISIATFIPYHLWKWTHKAMGGFFIAGTIHYLFILKPFTNGSALGLYVGAICAAGVLAYAVTLLPTALRRSTGYQVSNLRKTGGATEITMTPTAKPLRFAPGQFAVFTFGSRGLTEPHPFSLSAPPAADGSLQITVKALGDFTHRLGHDLTPGTPLHVQGPFGRFLRRPPSGSAEIWVAGGIGITPFLAWAEALPDDLPDRVALFWCVRSRSAAPQIERVEAAANRVANLTLHILSSESGDRLTAERIAATANGPIKLWFCGPAGLRRALQSGLARHGVSTRDIHYEEFEFRTGIGLKRLARFLLARQCAPNSRIAKTRR